MAPANNYVNPIDEFISSAYKTDHGLFNRAPLAASIQGNHAENASKDGHFISRRHSRKPEIHSQPSFYWRSPLYHSEGREWGARMENHMSGLK